jgi:hypothetical protein
MSLNNLSLLLGDAASRRRRKRVRDEATQAEASAGAVDGFRAYLDPDAPVGPNSGEALSVNLVRLRKPT